jgi:anti-sigma regulatory factor (Ser/Thr protein kinase)
VSRSALRLPRDPHAAALARQELDRLGAGLAPDLLQDARLVVSELVTNAVRHGSAGPTPWIELTCELTTSHLRIEVADSGGGSSRPTVQPRQADRPSGWGLYLVQRLADHWGVREGEGTLVWCELALR